MDENTPDPAPEEKGVTDDSPDETPETYDTTSDVAGMDSAPEPDPPESDPAVTEPNAAQDESPENPDPEPVQAIPDDDESPDFASDHPDAEGDDGPKVGRSEDQERSVEGVNRAMAQATLDRAWETFCDTIVSAGIVDGDGNPLVEGLTTPTTPFPAVNDPDSDED